jgi:hypothetical protein
MKTIQKAPGRKAGRGGYSVPKAAYPEIYQLHMSGQVCAADIGKPYGISASGVRTLVKRCRENPALLEVNG